MNTFTPFPLPLNQATTLVLSLSQLGKLIDQNQLTQYWQHGLLLLQVELNARAVSFVLLDVVETEPPTSIRLGTFTPTIESLLTRWEQTLSIQAVSGEEFPTVFISAQPTQPDGSSTFFHLFIVFENRQRGAITFVLDQEHIPSAPRQLSLYGLVQTFVGNALRAQQLYAMRERLHRANLLYQIAQAVTSSLDLQTVFYQTTELAASALNAQAATLFTVDRDNGELVFMITTGKAARELEEKRIPLDRGVAGWVATHGKPLIANQPRDNALFNPDVDSQTGFKTHNIVCVPLLIQERTVGVLEVLNKDEPAGFTTDDADWLAMMGQQIAIALENAQLFRREQEKVRELATLNAVSQTVNSDLDANAVLAAVTQSALEIASADRSELFLVDYRKRVLRLFANADAGGGTQNIQHEYPMDWGLPGWSIANNQPLLVRTAHQDSRHCSRSDRPDLDHSSVVVAPLAYRGRVVGAIVAYALSGRPFDLEKQKVLQTFANQVSVALQNAELYQNLRSEQERIIKAQEEVRHHLARELHDNTAQMLSLIAINLDLLRRLLTDPQPERVYAEIDETQRLARQANREVRTLLFELRPIILESRGLIPALRAYHRQLESSLQCNIYLEATTLTFQLTLPAANAVFSIIQEAVNNIRKHAKATTIWIRVSQEVEQLLFAVEDDGVGFAKESINEHYDESISFGLRNMKERAQLLSGGLEIHSPPPAKTHGTLVRGWAPIQQIIDLSATPGTK
jgi:signal transduction histidine kinase